jgi:hypothetical protein
MMTAMSEILDIQEDMRRAESTIRRAVEAPSVGQRLDALNQAYRILPPSQREAFIAVLIFRVAFAGPSASAT